MRSYWLWSVNIIKLKELVIYISLIISILFIKA